MKSKLNLSRSERIWASLMFGILGLAICYLPSISIVLMDSYNYQVEFLSSNMANSTYYFSTF